MLIRIYKYNNYYNRKVKLLTELSPEFANPVYASPNNINWNPNDGVNTEAIFGNSASNYFGNGDYLLAIDSNTNEINSRWFIIDHTRTKGGQWSVLLRRDLIADYHEEILNAPCFIERAILNNSDPFIFNRENFTYNQIKQSEYQIKDNTKMAWIVGYFDPKFNGFPAEEGKTTLSFTYNDVISTDFVSNLTFEEFIAQNEIFYDGDVDTIELASVNLLSDAFIKRYHYFNIGPTVSSNYWIAGRDNKDFDKYVLSKYRQAMNGRGVIETYVASASSNDAYSEHVNVDKALASLAEYKDDILARLIAGSFIPGLKSSSDVNTFLAYNNKTVRFPKGDGTFETRRLFVNLEETGNIATTYDNNVLNSLTEFLTKVVLKPSYENLDDFSLTVYQTRPSVLLSANKYKITSELVSDAQYTVNFEIKRLPNDASYGIFAIPYKRDSDTRFIYDSSQPIESRRITLNTEFALKFATALATELGSNLYDLQLLPYSPVPELYDPVNAILDIRGREDMYVPIKSGETTVSYIFFPAASSFSIDIPFTGYTFKNKKIEAETSFYRLVSPNYNGQFEFNAEKNNGITGFNIDCTYKPFEPYIHINPIFGGLYGKDWNDSRGLILGGSFGLEVYNDAWTQYQIQNKNYQNIFDRDIQSMDVSNQIQREKELFGAVTGTIGGTISGAVQGASGGVVGAIAGGVVGAGTSALGAAINYRWNEAMRNEAIDYRQDQFTYNLGNIQAMPRSLARTNALTYNNKLFPILEYFSCTEEEKVALAQKICYNSMTVMKIGTISDYINNKWSWTDSSNNVYNSKNYIKGKLIRLETLEDDFHIVNEISNEINKGVFYEITEE